MVFPAELKTRVAAQNSEAFPSRRGGKSVYGKQASKPGWSEIDGKEVQEVQEKTIRPSNSAQWYFESENPPILEIQDSSRRNCSHSTAFPA